jgi:hypothetical protein
VNLYESNTNYAVVSINKKNCACLLERGFVWGVIFRVPPASNVRDGEVYFALAIE